MVLSRILHWMLQERHSPSGFFDYARHPAAVRFFVDADALGHVFLAPAGGLKSWGDVSQAGPFLVFAAREVSVLYSFVLHWAFSLVPHWM